jgi:two-component sensor histidine kinase
MQLTDRHNIQSTFLVTCAPVRDVEGRITSVVETIKDISELKITEAKLVKTIEEKESLLKEIHHRVKNNLQAISGLLDIQALRMDDSVSKQAIVESQNRILSMALIHEHLYRHQDMSRINFTAYTRQLATNLRRSYGNEKHSIEITVRGEDINLNPDTVIPCSLILTELVSNALQHAFSDGNGMITISLDDQGDGLYRMIIADSGGSLPEGVDINSTDSFGLMLVRTFVDLLGGQIDVSSGDETAFAITFREYEEAQTLAV